MIIFCPGRRPRDLASFPTRRSSDLATEPTKSEPAKPDGQDAAPAQLKTSVQPINVIVIADTDILDDRFWVQVQDFLDRKSTRLNSSHPSISYAVFCLKKKKVIRCYLTLLPRSILLTFYFGI